MKTRLFILILFGTALSVMTADEGFKRYQIILDKRPFGEEPPVADAARVSPNQSFARHLRLSMLFEGPDGDVRVGIIDSSKKKNYILSIGQVEDSLELIEADLAASEAMVRKGNEVALFKMKSAAPETLSRSQQTARRSSYADRRKSRLAASQKKAAAKPAEPPEPRLTGAALQKHLENVQMDAIRKGLPPLPMALTPEMDSQLVAEGVLDPQ